VTTPDLKLPLHPLLQIQVLKSGLKIGFVPRLYDKDIHIIPENAGLW
jgi:hypothetical protein